MSAKKKQALAEFKIDYKNATTTEAKKEVRRNYNKKIQAINKWFNQEVKKVREECHGVQPYAPTSTPTTSTSTQQ